MKAKRRIAHPLRYSRAFACGDAQVSRKCDGHRILPALRVVHVEGSSRRLRLVNEVLQVISDQFIRRVGGMDGIWITVLPGLFSQFKLNSRRAALASQVSDEQLTA